MAHQPLESLIEKVLGADEAEATIAAIHLAHAGPQSIRPIVSALRKAKGRPYQRLVALARDLASTHGAELANLLTAPSDAAHAEHLARVFVEIGEQLVPHVQRLSKHADPRVRAWAYRALGEIGGDQTFSTIIEGIASADRWVRRQALRAAANCRSESGTILGAGAPVPAEAEPQAWYLIGVLAPSLGGGIDPWDSASSLWENIRERYTEAGGFDKFSASLGIAGEGRTDADIGALLEGWAALARREAHDELTGISLYAVLHLAHSFATVTPAFVNHITPFGVPLEEAVVRLLNTHFYYRALVETFVFMKRDGADIDPQLPWARPQTWMFELLVDTLRDPYEYMIVRTMAAMQLIELGDLRAVDPVLGYLEDPDFLDDYVGGVVSELHKIDHPKVRRFLVELVNSPQDHRELTAADSHVRWEAVLAIAELRSPGMVGVFMRALQEEGLRCEALDGLRQVASPEVRDLLARAWRDYRQKLTSPREFLGFSQTLYQHGQYEEALAAAEMGLSLPSAPTMARWGSDLAKAQASALTELGRADAAIHLLEGVIASLQNERGSKWKDEEGLGRLLSYARGVLKGAALHSPPSLKKAPLEHARRSRPGRSVPVDATIEARIEREYPFPIAERYRMAARDSLKPERVNDVLAQVPEVLMNYHCAIALADAIRLHKEGHTTPGLSQTLAKIIRGGRVPPQYRDWKTTLDGLTDQFHRSSLESFVPELTELTLGKTKAASEWLLLLSKLRKLRNARVHLPRPDEEAQRVFYAQSLPLVTRILKSCDFHLSYMLVRNRGSNWDEEHGMYTHHVDKLMGFEGIRTARAIDIQSECGQVVSGHVLLFEHEGRRWLDLDPWLIAKWCRDCTQDQMFFLQRIVEDKGGLAGYYQSYSCAHSLPTGVGKTFLSLLMSLGLL